MENKKMIPWINCAKFMAICGVMVDHTVGILYRDRACQWASFYSVSLFILISGLLTYRSIQHHNYSYGKTVMHSLKKIVIAYLIATFIYQVWAYRSFDFARYINGLIMFNVSGPFYYVLLYIWLMLTAKIIYSLVAFKTRAVFIKDLTVGYCVIAVSYITTNYSNVLNVYGGGGKLLGGTYLFLFYLGMIFAKYKVFEKITTVKCLIASVIGGTVYLGCWYFACGNGLSVDSHLHFGGFNPPGITFMTLSLGMILLCYGVFSLTSRVRFLSAATGFVSSLVSHTLYIFLFHRFWLDYILRPYVAISDEYVRALVYYGVMTGGSILIESAVGAIVKTYRRIEGKAGNVRSGEQPFLPATDRAA